MDHDFSPKTVQIQGFTVVQLKYRETSKAAHCLYLKEHTVREKDSAKPRERTLFVLNVPPYCNEENLRRVFGCCGKILRVYVQDKPSAGLPKLNASEFFPDVEPNSGFKVVYIVFKTAQAVQNAKKLPYDKPLVLSTENNHVVCGIKKWLNEYRQEEINRDDLQKEIDSYMKTFDRKQEEEEKRLKKADGVPDEDGWVTVTRMGKNKGTPRTEAQTQRITKKEKKRRKEKELLNFYTFQIREGKRDQIATLRQKFEEDKQRIALMKASRKFKPY